VYGWRRKKDAEVPEHFDAVLPSLKEVLDIAEIVFITLPATSETEGLISKDHLMSMKGKFLVNVGRGSIVDEEGLYEALKSGVLKGAALDTWYTYPTTGVKGAPSRFPIHTLPNVVLSPHVGAPQIRQRRNRWRIRYGTSVPICRPARESGRPISERCIERIDLEKPFGGFDEHVGKIGVNRNELV